jgi:hypothetical protein
MMFSFVVSSVAVEVEGLRTRRNAKRICAAGHGVND